MPHLRWTEDTARHVLDASLCPRCGSDALVRYECRECGADLSGPIAGELWQASLAAAEVLRARQAIIDRVPVRQLVGAGVAMGSTPPPPAAASLVDTAPPVAAPGPVGASESAPPPRVPPAAASAAAAAERSSITVQSVLAVAGAGLFGIAAIVFTFFNPDLTDVTTRNVIVAITTVLFLGGAWMLARRGLRFSAEAVGALGMVFVALDVYAVADAAPDGLSIWIPVAAGTFVAGAIMLVVATLSRLRTWLWLSLLAIAVTPVMLGAASGDRWVVIVGQLCSAFAAYGAYEVARWLERRFDSPLAADRGTLTALQAVIALVVVVQLPTLSAPTVTQHWLGIIAVLAAVAILAAANTRNQAAAVWSYVAGGLGVTAAAFVPLTFDVADAVWYLALIPAAAGIASIALTGPPRLGPVLRPQALSGGYTVALIALVPAGAVAVLQSLSAAAPALFDGNVRGLTPAETFAVPATTSGELFGSDFGLAAILGVAAGALTAFALSRLVRTRSGLAVGVGRALSAVALWFGGLTLTATVTWSAFSRPVQLGLALLLIVGLALLVLRVARTAAAPLRLRVPIIFTSIALLVIAGFLSWADANLTVVGGVLLLGALALIAQLLPAVVRPVLLGVGYAYALIVFATAMDIFSVPRLLGADPAVGDQIVVLCLTATLASLVALAATLTRLISVRGWYAVLIVTSIPFVIGVIAVLLVRTGWLALPAGVTFALALTLLLTHREGISRLLRIGAASLLVPALAVVITNAGAQLLSGSASPVVLPIIAAIVAVVLPSTGLIGDGLERRGIASTDAAGARIAVEVSTLVTGALAVVLALARVAAQLPTAFLVLLIIGVGALATAIWGRRIYGYWLAGASFTGALWCVWALNGVTLVEPYLLPPTLAAAIIGVILVGRGVTRAVGLYTTGLAVAAVPTVVILGAVGSGDSATPWRAYGLLASSVVLLGIGWLMPRHPSRLAPRLGALAVPTLTVGIIVAAAGAAQAMRLGWERDPLPFGDPSSIMWPVLAFSVTATVLAAIGARILRGTPARLAVLVDDDDDDRVADAVADAGGALSRSRWLYAPAVVFLVAGPMTAIRDTPLAIWTLWSLMVTVLLVMVLATVRGRAHATSLPPVWFLFAVAFATAVVGWSEREILRVEGWSLPLGGFLLIAGVIAMLPAHDDRSVPSPTVTRWPIGASGSWPALAPGIIVVFLASISATGTDPQTWRAILVIAIALGAIIVGSFRKLAAPFILGLIAAALEILMVFVVQIGRRIDPVLWWITLATAGAVLLVIAVTSERRGAKEGEGGWSGRMRDLR